MFTTTLTRKLIVWPEVAKVEERNWTVAGNETLGWWPEMVDGDVEVMTLTECRILIDNLEAEARKGS